MSENDGSQTRLVNQDARLLVWLLAELKPMPRTRVKQLLAHGCIAVNGNVTTQFDTALVPGDEVVIAREGNSPKSRAKPELSIVFEDEDLIVVDKPAGMLTVATDLEKLDTAFVRLKNEMASRNAGRPFVVHRLDRETSGLLVFTRNVEVRERLQANWEGVTKTYLAVVEGSPSPAEGMVRNYLTEGRDLRVRASETQREDSKHAVTRYKLMETRGSYSLMEVVIKTGRKHQIRVHLAGLGSPIIGDPYYGSRTNPARRLGLHAWRLGFEHPRTGERLELESPLPDSLRRMFA